MEETYTYDPRNRLTSHTKGGVTTPYVYDNAGNLLRDGKALYEYDGFNRAVKVDTFDGNVQINRYDAEGLRYELEENNRLVQFIFHRQEVVSEQSEMDTIRLIRGYDLITSDAQSARTYYHYASDEMGSTTHIVNKDGAIQNQYAYDAFGNVTAQKEAVPNRFKFNGQQLDPVTGQYYLRARFYNPVVARFTQEDVYRGDGLNLYAYCRNNPVVYSDPSGYCSGGEQMTGQRDAGGQMALPAPPTQLALPAPPRQLALPAPKAVPIKLTPQSPAGILAFGDGSREYVVSWMNESAYQGYYSGKGSAATLGAPGGAAWVMSGADADAARSVGAVARDAGMAGGIQSAYKGQQPIYAVVVPADQVTVSKPTAQTPGVNENWNADGYTHVVSDGPNGFSMNTGVAEFVVPGGTKLPAGSFAVEFSNDGWITKVQEWE